MRQKPLRIGLYRQLPGWFWVALLWAVSSENILLAQEKSTSPAVYLGEMLRPAELPPRQAAAALQQAEQQLSLLPLADTTGRYQVHVAAGQAAQALRRYHAALKHYRQALLLTRPSSAAAAGVLARLGHTLQQQGDTGQARSKYQQALQLYRLQQNRGGQARLHEQLGLLYGGQDRWRRAQTSHEQALALWQAAGDQRNAIGSLNYIGRAHQRQRHHSRALYYRQLGLAKAEELHDDAQTSQLLHGIGELYQELGNHEVALSYFTRALRRLPDTAPASVRAATLGVVAAMHDSLQQPELAERYLRQATEEVRPASPTQRSTLYYSLASVYRRQGRPDEALAALSYHAALQDSAFAEQRAVQIADLRTRYETEKKEREIQLLTKDRQLQEATLHRQKQLRNLLAVGSLLLLAAVAALYRGRQQQQRANRLLQHKNTAISRQKEELDRLNQTKNTLFSIISHDLRSPLSSLYSLLSLLNLGTLPPEKLAVHSARLTRMLDGTLHLLDNLLNWSAAQMQGEGAARPERVRLDSLIEETLLLLLGDAERKEIQLINQVQTPLLARADVNMARLVLRNLLSNALKFTPPGGTVTVTAAPQGSSWQVTVRDTGVGIDPAYYDNISGLTGPHTTLGTASEKGTGLGLRLCRDFVDRNGGQLWFESELGRGTTFHFTLPMAAPETAVHPASTAAEPAAAAVPVQLRA
ncbi:ATP-binding protein [Hymenobacter weizhouensis]|uniref:ATP-binding protein n=1 Tax=Hymenobacter sp. YIM 151500-1 TaxID=2987689 RepID=UPI002225CA60|nr:ATP-binding protein [Hymenobacter sp. YIM 151500-1]UYZ64834.1 tetratricopeptide repeat protein [Hymenobacter sp. YIM 151500-1]